MLLAVRNMSTHIYEQSKWHSRNLDHIDADLMTMSQFGTWFADYHPALELHMILHLFVKGVSDNEGVLHCSMVCDCLLVYMMLVCLPLVLECSRVRVNEYFTLWLYRGNT